MKRSVTIHLDRIDSSDGSKRSVDVRCHVSNLRQSDTEFLLRTDKTYDVGLETKTKVRSWDHQDLRNILPS